MTRPAARRPVVSNPPASTPRATTTAANSTSARPGKGPPSNARTTMRANSVAWARIRSVATNPKRDVEQERQARAARSRQQPGIERDARPQCAAGSSACSRSAVPIRLRNT